jgi:hypothetical protein
MDIYIEKKNSLKTYRYNVRENMDIYIEKKQLKDIWVYIHGKRTNLLKTSLKLSTYFISAWA